MGGGRTGRHDRRLPGAVARLSGAAPAGQPQHVVAERLGQQYERGSDRDRGERAGQHVTDLDGEHDALDRGDDLAPESRRHRFAQPREQPPCDDVCVAGEPDREHPRAEIQRGVRAQHQDQERVDLHVEARPERRHGVGAARQLAVDPVEHERGRGNRHDGEARARAGQRVCGERGYGGHEHRAGERDVVGRPECGTAARGQRRVEQEAGTRTTGDADRPPQQAQLGADRERGEQRDRADRRRDQRLCRRLCRRHRASGSNHSRGSRV